MELLCIACGNTAEPAVETGARRVYRLWETCGNPFWNESLDGVPTKDGTYTFPVAVDGTDASLVSHVATRSYTLVIHPA